MLSFVTLREHIFVRSRQRGGNFHFQEDSTVSLQATTMILLFMTMTVMTMVVMMTRTMMTTTIMIMLVEMKVTKLAGAR